MKIKKITTPIVIMGTILLVGVLTGCSTNNDDNDEIVVEPAPTFTSTDYETDLVPVKNFDDSVWDTLPAVTNITENSFVVINAEASDCPSVIDHVEYTPNVVGTDTFKVKIVYKDNEGSSNPCSGEAEVVNTATEISVDEGVKIPTWGNVAFEFDLPDAPIISAGFIIPNELVANKNDK